LLKKMEGNAFTVGLLTHHESVKEKRLFSLLVESIVDDEEICEAHMLINGDEDFRLEVEESSSGDQRTIRISIYRALAGEHVSSSITAEMDYEERDAAYYYVDERFPRMSLADVYSEIMDVIRRVEKVALV
jgi:hypothetical protein